MTKAHTEVVHKALVETAARKTSAGKPSRHRSVANHAIKRNAELAIQLLYPHFTEYLRSLLREMYEVRPLDVVGKAQASIRFDEVVRLGSYEAVCEHMINQVFRNLEGQRNTRKLLSKVLEKTGVEVDREVLQDAMMYMDMRHLIVHNSSLVDEAFERSYGSTLGVKAGRRLKVDLGTAKRAVELWNICVCKLTTAWWPEVTYVRLRLHDLRRAEPKGVARNAVANFTLPCSLRGSVFQEVYEGSDVEVESSLTQCG